MVPLIPRFGRVLVRLAERQGAKAATTQSGLHLPQSVTDADRNYQVGFVAALPVDDSDESKKIRDLKLNSKVILPKYTSQKFNFDEEEFVLATSQEILGIFNKEASSSNASSSEYEPKASAKGSF
ncbi:MAG: hypothetical protein MHMPM18_003332 [Marteilia pararefringens]